ncbi:L-aspartate oxidase [Fusobacterium sp.]|uniref:L-aspartate oxidase n=1 Tax=Fusobacterium sp. TaxID=68766 RepID=UPI002618AADF|nr:L-aspartate oxidase [Fusobacterium sp.]
MKREYDVIVVGTGVSGCFTALHLSSNLRILLITKEKLEESDSFLAQGGICVLKEKDDFSSFFEDTLKAGHYENNKKSVEVMINSSQDIIRELIDYGVDFNSKDGKLLFTREGAHSKERILYHEDITGEEITSKLLAQVKRRENIEIVEKTSMLDIINNNNSCEGIVVKDSNGEIFNIYSKMVVLATGGIGGIFENSTNFPHLTGDSLGIALKHDIKIKDISYIQIHPTTLYSEKKGRRFLISESVRGEGALLYNQKYERFTDELQPRDVVTKAILEQMKKDSGKSVWLDMRPIMKKGIDIKERFPNIVKRCLEEGYDPEKECIPVVPAQHYFMGGIEVDLKSSTSMKNLYAVGETSCNGVHGANRLASNSLLESLVFSERAALDINERLLKEEFYQHSIDEKVESRELSFEELKEELFIAIEKDKRMKESRNGFSN